MGDFRLAQAGDPDALMLLVRKNIRLVQALCARFPYSEDAFQQGCIGLVLAIRRYNEDAGTRFSTYAVPCILGEIRRALPSRLNWRMQKASRGLAAARERLEKALMREPTVSELSAETGLSTEDILLLQERKRAPLSFDAAETLLILPDPHSLAWLERFLLRDILNRLPAQDKRLLYVRFTLNKTQTQAARVLCMTQPCVSRRERQLCMRVRAEWIGQ